MTLGAQTQGGPGVKDPGERPGVRAESAGAAAFPLVRQGPSFEAKLVERPQKVMFVKSQATDAKAAIANLLLSDVGLNLITMALAPQMKAWNPYMNDSIRKGIDLGKGMLVGHGSDTKGFEYETLPGTTADLTLKEGPAEFLVPMNSYIPSADFDISSVQPVILRLESRDKDAARIMSARQVALKQNKTGRFDLKPTIDRQEANVEQNLVPVNFERLPGNIFKVTPKDALGIGEYALVFRKPSSAGIPTANVALKPTPPAAAAPATPQDPMAAMMAQMQGAQGAPNGQPGTAPSRSPLGMLRRGGQQPPPPLAAMESQAGMAGFIAWDFRVLRQN
ncbi:MAG TPA: hypothetical protein VMZ52_03035 [Bryobacteraceae bacterium]|nr:hypothetical protein [Bryobacteraceae bacterium]